MKRVLKTLIFLTILGVVAAYLWKRWQSRAPGPLWREDEGPRAVTPEPATETAPEPASEPVFGTPAEEELPPALPAIVAAAPLVADADFREMLAEDQLLASIQSPAAEPEESAPLPPLPDWATPPVVAEPEAPLQLSPVEEPGYLAPPPPLAAEAPAVAPPPPGERWYWPWQQRRPEVPVDDAQEAGSQAEPAEAAPPAGPGLAAVAEVEAAEEAPWPPAPVAAEMAFAPVADTEALEQAPSPPEAELPIVQLEPAPPPAAEPVEFRSPEEVLAALPTEATGTPAAPVVELQESPAADLEPWTDEPAAREEGGFRWPWQRDDAAAPLAATPNLEHLADQLDAEPPVVEEAEPAPPLPEQPSRETTGFRWPWQKRKEDEVAAPEPPAVDQAEFEETGLSWGITDEDESVAAEWLETAPSAPVEPEPFPVMEQETRRPPAPVESVPPPEPSFIPGAPLTNVLEAALEQVRPEPVAQYAGRSAESFLDEGNVYFNVGQYGLAIERYSRALELDPNLTAGYYNRANARTRAGEYDLALDDYNSALELEPNDADALNNRGMLHLYRAGYGSALRDFNAALQIDPTDTTVIVNRGLAQLHGGDPAAALVDFQEAAALDDMDAAAHYGAAQAASALGNREEALRRLRRALQIDPAYAREAAADAKLVPLQGDAEFMRILREAGGRR